MGTLGEVVMQSSLAMSIRTAGCIGAERPWQSREVSPASEKLSVGDFVAKMTALFSPYMKPEMSERDFAVLEGEVKKLALKFKRGA